MEVKESATHLIKLTERQVRDAMEDLVEHIQTQWPDAREAENVALFLSREFERNLLRHYVAHRIADCLEIAWLLANDVRWTIKSSVDQFVDQNMIRVQLTDAGEHKAFSKWLNG